MLPLITIKIIIPLKYLNKRVQIWLMLYVGSIIRSLLFKFHINIHLFWNFVFGFP